MPVLRMGNLGNGRLDFVDLKYLPAEPLILRPARWSEAIFCSTGRTRLSSLGSRQRLRREIRTLVRFRVSQYVAVSHPVFRLVCMFDKVSLEEITDEFAKAAGEDLSFVAGADLLDVVRQTERLRRFLDAVESHALARIDVTNVCELEFGMTAGSWLAHECLLPAGVAKKRVRVATKLATVLPRTNQALTKGEIGFDHGGDGGGGEPSDRGGSRGDRGGVVGADPVGDVRAVETGTRRHRAAPG